MPEHQTLGQCSWCSLFKATRAREWTGKASGTIQAGEVCDHCWAAFLTPGSRSKCACRTHELLRKLRKPA